MTRHLLSGCSAADGSMGTLPSALTIGIGLAWLGRDPCILRLPISRIAQHMLGL